MKRSGPDSLNSWVIAGACCFINMMMYGMMRLSGVLFVATVPVFNVSREAASFPYTFATFVRNTSGPLVGFLGHRFGVRAVTSFGCLLGAVGIGTCYFAESIDTVTVLWGAVFGLGFGLGNILLPVAINQYFDKHRATASGISFSGACLGSFILPPVVELLLSEYSLSGTYLFLAGFVLNCVPAALALKKPKFDITKTTVSNDCERQSIMSGKKVKLYTVEDQSIIPSLKNYGNITEKQNSISSGIRTYLPTVNYEEKITRMSSQTLPSELSNRINTSDSSKSEETMKNRKARMQVDPSVLEAETYSSSSQNTDTDINSEKDDVSEKVGCSSSVQYEQPIGTKILNHNRTLSPEGIPNDKSSFLSQNCIDGLVNYGYQNDRGDLRFKNNAPYISSISHQDLHKGNFSKSYDSSDAYPKQHSMFKYSSERYKTANNQSMSKSFDFSDIDSYRGKNGTLSSLQTNNSTKEKKISSLESFNVIFDPMFILIATNTAIYCFTFVCMITIIVDFARDLNIGITNEKYILMTLSVGDLVGRLGLGWITDHKYMTTTNFAALCFACQGAMLAATVSSNGFVTLMIIVTLFGLAEAGLIIIFPIIIAQYIDHDKQTVAIPSSNFLSGPLCLAVAPLIGYFRDDLGSYNYIFYGLSVLSFLCSLSWLLPRCIARCRIKNSEGS